MKKILIGVTGSIAAYKVAELIRLLTQSGHEVRVVMTASATQFITPLTLQVLSGHKVRTALFDIDQEGEIDHISLARWADCILIAPCTANFIAKLTTGMADDLLSTLCLATQSPITLAPAMNQAMWHHPVTQANINQLTQHGIQIIAPASGEQACGEIGPGRMAEPTDIFNQIHQNHQPLLGKHLMITAGATIERIDPVRFLSNDSSGKMGLALAQAAYHMGAKVTLIAGKLHTPPPAYLNCITVESARDMLAAVMAQVDHADWFIATAAVADYGIDSPMPQKIKKQGDNNLTLTLSQNPDILQTVCQLKNAPFTVGFAAETEAVIDNARAKRLKKGADLICANDVSTRDMGFNSDDNAVTVIGEGWEKSLPKASKAQLAYDILLACIEYHTAHSATYRKP
ncbi:bifunctional phosphopantothenoylcysteine decarboxylase/phosphopantothenate--cysteine ligase CoaBC [Ostreibacterium oceani]|uniref:Coenzyme A biosynthesis bifunctional protein CoaBC n=1 Tax=Ostreibacterium oceani TaxID=2654998 RepID=A0A6N7EV18_9GAMM|nr:bifunctional phosphopantothenoylcysteine decarboxylase/phosphopantothenate--cysteine ligase CoaBC [Ostreibacterium oceani]MPV86302.1 bifunctional phosphopantothenoylcysteine decarboxylase/phosphopantothenate--cysteine ligase CoaBC [Ostreibacterium oceani]